MNCRLQFLQRSLRGGEGPLRDAYLILHFQSSLDADPERVSHLPLLLSCPSPGRILGILLLFVTWSSLAWWWSWGVAGGRGRVGWWWWWWFLSSGSGGVAFSVPLPLPGSSPGLRTEIWNPGVGCFDHPSPLSLLYQWEWGASPRTEASRPRFCSLMGMEGRLRWGFWPLLPSGCCLLPCIFTRWATSWALSNYFHEPLVELSGKEPARSCRLPEFLQPRVRTGLPPAP